MKAAEAAVKATAKTPKPSAKVQPDVTLDVHVQWNGATEANTLRFVHVHLGKKVVAKGELPLGLATLTGEVGVQSQSEILEIIGTHTLAYTKNVYNGFKRRHDHPKDWNAWTARHKAALWALFGQVNVAGSQPGKEAKARLETAAGQARAALAKPKVDEGVFAGLIAAVTRDFAEEGNEAKWNTVVDPKKPVTAEVVVSGAKGKNATYSKARIRGGRLVKKPKTLRDVHDQGVDIAVSIPSLKNAYRGGFTYRGRQPSFRADTIQGLKDHFPSRGRSGLGITAEMDIEGILYGFAEPRADADFEGWGVLADRLLDGVIESVVDPVDPTAA